MKELKNNRGTQFDPEIVDMALQVLARDENES
jgi:HD-GYP domain-containing protein (c-di-GMP phosphodiesterase class II)